MPPTYRERLRVEGGVLAAAGALASALLLIAVPQASERALSTIGQLIVVTVLLLVLTPRGTRRSVEGARPLPAAEQVTGEPTPLWKPPLVVLVLATLFILPGVLLGSSSWDAGLRITGGCLLVGLAQALLIERIVAADEARSGRRYFRVPGWRLTSGTKLGFFSDRAV